MRKFINVVLDIIIAMLIAGIVFVVADLCYMDTHKVYEYSFETNTSTTEIHHIDGRVDYIYS